MTRFTLQSWHQQAFDGSTSPPSPLLSLQIAGPDEQDWLENRTFASILVVADDVGEDVIIGRDLLNRLRFLYDGPAQQLLLVE